MRRSTFIAGATGAAILGARAAADAQLLPGQTYLQQLSVGVSVPLSGPLQKYGTQVVAGVRASIDYVNRYMSAMQGRIYGIRAFDDQDSSTVATTNVQIAANDPSVIAMIGNLTADVTITNIPNYQNVGFALIVPATTDDGVTDRGYRNVFRLPTKDITEGLLFARATLMGRKPVVAIAVALDDGYGFDVARGITQQAKNDRHQADTMLFPAKGFDPANAARAVVAREPAFVFLAGRTSDLGPLAEALRLAGYIGEFGASNGFYGEATTASYATVMANALVSTSLPPLDKIPDQIQQYTFLGNQLGQITAFSAFGFASAQIAILASQRANATTRLTLLSALQTGGTYDTLLGPFSFGVNGDPTLANIFLYKITKDGFVFVKPAIATPYVI